MQVFKAIIGAFIGGGIGAFLSTLSPGLLGETNWLILLAGLGAGLGARVVCGADRTFVTGLIAAVAAVLAMAGASLYTSMSEINELADVREPLPAPVIEMADPEQEVVVAAEVTETADVAETADATETADAADIAVTESESEPSEDAAATENLSDADDNAAANAAYEAANEAQSEFVGDLEQGETKVVNDTVMEYLLNAMSALLAFALGTGRGAASKSA